MYTCGNERLAILCALIPVGLNYGFHREIAMTSEVCAIDAQVARAAESAVAVSCLGCVDPE